jgi:hypothetical protein
VEAFVSTENWAQERERLLGLLGSLESGRLTHFDEDETGQLRRHTTVDSIASIKQRLADLEARLGRKDEAERSAGQQDDLDPNGGTS